MRLDVLARAGLGVGRVEAAGEHRVAHPVEHRLDQLGQLLGERRERVGEVGALGRAPLARHVGLAEPDHRAVREPREELLGPVDDQRRPGLAERGAVQLTVGQPDGDGHVAQDALDDRAGDLGAQPVRRSGGQQLGGGDDAGLEGGAHAECIPLGAWCGRRGTTGRRRSQSRMPCQRISAETRCEGSGLRARARTTRPRVAGRRPPWTAAVKTVSSPWASPGSARWRPPPATR